MDGAVACLSSEWARTGSQISMSTIFFDCETFSTVDVKRGVDRYMSAPEFAVLIVTYAIDDGPVQLWRVAEDAPLPDDLSGAIDDPATVWIAHNCVFDRSAFFYGLGIEIEIEQTRCTMAQAYAHALPGSLEALGAVLGLPPEQQKIMDGHRLIMLFCVPDKNGNRKATYKTHPEDWEKFVEYAIQDTAALRSIHQRLPTHNYKGVHIGDYIIDQEINERGFQADLRLAYAAMAACEGNKAILDAEIEELTNGIITKPTQRERILHHVVGEDGLLMLDLQAETIKKVLEDEKDLAPETRRLLEIRLEGAMTSITKYQRAVENCGPDERMRHTLQFSGAGRTGRWAGRGFQPHNMPRPTIKWQVVEDKIIPAILAGKKPDVKENINEACANALRSTIIAKPGHELLVADWANIEGRVLAWLSGEAWKLDAYRANDADEGPDGYVALYARSFGIPVTDVTGPQRQMGKGMDLSMGFGGGVGAFGDVAKTYGLDLPELGKTVPNLGIEKEIMTKAENNWERAFVRGNDFGMEPDVFIACDVLKQVYRRFSPKITSLWWDLERAIKYAIRHPGSSFNVGRCKIWCAGAWLIIELPSTRRLLYAKPRVKVIVEEDEESGEMTAKDSISYMAANAKQWRRERSYGGKFAENITQAVANDVLRIALRKLKAHEWRTVLHVHDDIANEEVFGTHSLQELIDLMTEEIPWAKTLPLAAAGYVSERYRKD